MSVFIVSRRDPSTLKTSHIAEPSEGEGKDLEGDVTSLRRRRGRGRDRLLGFTGSEESGEDRDDVNQK